MTITKHTHESKSTFGSSPLVLWFEMLVFSIAVVIRHPSKVTNFFHYLDHQNPHIRRLAIRTFSKMKTVQSLPILKKRYAQETQEDIRLEILKAIGKEGSHKDLSFLEKQLKSPSNKEVLETIHAMTSIDSKYHQYNKGALVEAEKECM